MGSPSFRSLSIRAVELFMVATQESLEGAFVGRRSVGRRSVESKKSGGGVRCVEVCVEVCVNQP